MTKWSDKYFAYLEYFARLQRLQRKQCGQAVKKQLGLV